MYNYFDQSNQTKKAAIELAAQKMKVSPIIIEKDLWVTLTLNVLFADKFSDVFVFKGGTSLSKAYGIIERFSEDIDVTINREIFGKHFSLQELGQKSRKEREKIIESLKEDAHRYIKSQIIPSLKSSMEDVSKEKLDFRFSDKDMLSVEIFYPTFFPENYTYIRPRIYIEFGIRGELEPHEERHIQCYLEREIPDIKFSQTIATVLSPIRTFYEKATLLHQESNRVLDKGTRLRLSRHYYDLHQLVSLGYLTKALNSFSLLEAVIIHKNLLFSSALAQYDRILKEGIKLIPEEARTKDLSVDYKEMAEMFFGEYPKFDQILDSIKHIEKEINNKILR